MEEVDDEINDADDIAYQDEDEELQPPSDEDNDAESLNSTYDMTLATAHSYLGNNLEILHGRTLLDNGIYIDLPLWCPQAHWEQKVILFPGQTLPIMEHDIYSQGMFRKCIAKNRTFGVAYKIDINCIGTTAEICEYSEDPSINEIRIKAKGRQRFKIIKLKTISLRKTILADVQILPEITLPPPYFEHRLITLDRLRVVPIDEQTAKKYCNLTKTESYITPWPAWVYNQYNPRLLSLKIHKYLQFLQLKFAASGNNIPTDPIDLSFWVAHNVILLPKDMMKMLKENCAISRLQIQVKLLAKLVTNVYVCKRCHVSIAKQTDAFPMNEEGLSSAYVNTSGVIHDTVTLSRAQSLVLSPTPPSTDCSWFPGYAWTIAMCANCKGHMGWRFTATKSDLKPKSFWGLTRSALSWEDGELHL